jgi:MSHA biogenesis protein MshJ
MKLPAGLEKSFARFNALSLRERALIAAALITALVMLWDAAMMQPVRQREIAATRELKAIADAGAALQANASAETPDPTAQALEQERSLQSALEAVNLELSSASAGLIPPERMVDVIQDVLNRQSGVRLISLRNQPVESLFTADASAQTIGPYVHPIELTIEGGYLDVLAYLQALEGLPWRLYWKVIEIETRGYPLNRARIELSTLSMDKEWLGV